MTHPDMRIEGRIVGVRSTDQSRRDQSRGLLTSTLLYKTLNEKSICG